MTIDSDSDAGDDDGLFTVDAAATISSTNNLIDITANDLSISGDLDSGTATITIRDSDGDGVGLGAGTVANGISLSNSDLDDFTAGGLTVITTGNLVADGFSQAATIGGTTTLQSSSQITFSGTASSLNTLVVEATDQIEVSADLSTTVGSLSLDGDSDGGGTGNNDIQIGDGVVITSADSVTLQAQGAGIVGQGAVTINAIDGVNINHALDSSGVLTIDADSDADGSGLLTIASGAAVSTSDQAINLTVADMDIFESVDSGTATTTIQDSDGAGIGLGDAVITGGLNLSVTDFQVFTAGGMVLTTAGDIEVDNISASDSDNIAGTTQFIAGQTVTFASGGAVFNALSVDADRGINLDGNLQTDTGDLALDGDANDTDDPTDPNDNIAFATGVQVTSAGLLSLSATTGGMNSAGALTLQANDGITLSDSLSTAGTLTLNADTDAGDDDGLLTVDAGATISSTDNSIDITANDLSISGDFDSGTASTTLRDSDGDGIGVGSGSVVGGMNISNTDLQDFTATGLSLITNGSMVVDGFSQSATITGTTTLQSSAEITFSGSASTLNSLVIEADDRIEILADLSTSVGDLSLDGDADAGGSGGNDIQIGDGVVISSAASLTMQAQGAGIIGQGATTVNAVNGVNINHALDSSGILTVDSDSDADGTGVLAIASGAAVSTSDQAINLTVADMDIFESVDSGTATTTIQDSDGAGIGLGDAIITGGLNLSVTDFADFTAGGLVLTTSGNIEVENMSQPATLSGTTSLNATGATSTVSFLNVSSSFNTLEVNATEGVVVSADLSSTVNGITISADSDAGDESGTLTVSAGVSITTNNQSLQITANDVALDGSLDSGSQSTTIQDSDGSGIGLGNASITNGLNLDDSEMQLITASGLSLITGGEIRVDGVTQANSVSGTVTLDSTGDISFENGASNFESLDAQSDQQISLSVDVTTDSGDLTLTADADSSGGGSDTLLFSANTSITSSGAMTLSGSQLSAAGDLSLDAADGVEISNDFEASGALTINADTDAGDSNGQFIVALGTTLRTNGNSLSITADSLSVSGDIDAGTGSIDITDSDGTGIGLGDATISGGINFSTSVAGQFSSGDFGLTTQGNATVENFTQPASITGVFTVNATGTTSTIELQTTASTFEELVLNASDGVSVGTNLTLNSGPLTVVSDADAGDNSGTFTVDSGITVSTSNQGVSVTANDFSLSGALDAGTGQVTLVDSDGGGVGLGSSIVVNGLNVGSSEMDSITASSLTLQTTSSIFASTVSQSASAPATTVLDAAQSIQFAGAASSFLHLDARADAGVDIDVDLTSTTGDLLIDGDHDDSGDATDGVDFASGVQIVSAGVLSLDATGGGLSGAGALALQAADGIGINDSLTTQGSTSIESDSDANDNDGTLTVAAGVVISTSNQTLSIVTDAIDLQGNIDAGSASVSFTGSDSDSIGLGGSVVTGGLNLSHADLAKITGSDLNISSSDDINVDGVSQPATITGQINLSAAAGISFLNGSSTLVALDAEADQGITVNVNIQTTSGVLNLDGDANNASDGADDIQFAAGVQLTSSSSIELDAASGQISAAGALGLAAADGVSILADMVNSGALTIDADTDSGDGDGTLSVGSGASISVANQDLQITANDVDLSGGLSSGTSQTTLIDSDGGGIGLGGTTLGGGLNLGGSELQLVTAGDLLLSTQGDIAVDGITSTNSASISGTTTLESAGEVSFSSNASTFNTLDVQADAGISVQADVTTVAGDLNFDADHDNDGNTSDRLAFGSGQQLQSAGTLSLDATGGGIQGSGALDLTSADGVNINDDFTTTGTLTVNADSDAGDGNGTFQTASGIQVSTSNNALVVTANDVNILGDITTGTAGISLVDSDQGGIGLGASSVTGGLNVDSTELSLLEANGLSLSTDGDIQVNAVTQPTDLTGLITLAAGGATSDISFTGGASTFEALSVDSDQSVSIGVSIQATAGDLSLSAGSSLSVSSGTQVIGAGSGTTLSVNAASVTLGDGASGSETVKQSATGAIAVVSDTSAITLGDHALATDTGSISLNSASTIDESTDSDTINLSTGGALSLVANGSIGNSAGASLAGTDALDFTAGNLTAQALSTGGIHLRHIGDVTANQMVTSDGGIDLLSTGALSVQGGVTAGGTGDVNLIAPEISFGSGGDVTTNDGSIAVSATDANGLIVDTGASFTTNSGSVSGQLVNSSNPFNGTVDTGDALSDSNRQASIRIFLDDSTATEIDIEIDWQEGDPVGPVVVNAPGDSRTQIVQSTVSPGTSGVVFSHDYESAPDPNDPSADINVGLSIIQIAGGSISLLSGGSSVFQAGQFLAQTLVLEVDAPILPFFISIPEEASIDVLVPAPTVITQIPENQRTYVAETVIINSSSIGTTQETSQRYYVLRIVTFGSEGEVKLIQQDQEFRLPDMEDSESEAGFEISQLPQLFERLPDDRYRIYKIEGETERLVLDFIIRDGQPIEAQQMASQTDETSDHDSEPENVGAENVGAKEGQLRRDISQNIDDASPPLTVIEKLGQERVLSIGGAFITAGMFRSKTQRRSSENSNKKLGSQRRSLERSNK